MTTACNPCPLTQEDVISLTQILNLKHAPHLKNRLFSVSARDEGSTLWASITLANSSHTFFYPVEARAEKNTFPSAKEGTLFLLDFLGTYFEAFFEEEEGIFVPIDWTPYSWDGQDFFMKGQILNLEQEKRADELLMAIHLPDPETSPPCT